VPNKAGAYVIKRSDITGCLIGCLGATPSAESIGADPLRRELRPVLLLGGWSQAAAPEFSAGDLDGFRAVLAMLDRHQSQQRVVLQGLHVLFDLY
jgi:hypothetical protein